MDRKARRRFESLEKLKHKPVEYMTQMIRNHQKYNDIDGQPETDSKSKTLGEIHYESLSEQDVL